MGGRIMTGLTLEQYLGLCTLDFDVFKDKTILKEYVSE